MILDVDKSEVVSAHLILSPMLGPISDMLMERRKKTIIGLQTDR